MTKGMISCGLLVQALLIGSAVGLLVAGVVIWSVCGGAS